MKKIIILLLILITALFVISTVSANDDDIIIDENERTITVTGKTIVYETGYKDYSDEAKNQIKEFKKINKKNPTTYTVTLSKKQYIKLGNAKTQDKYKDIQINTDQPIIIKKAVIKTDKTKIFSKKYYDENQFNKALKKFEKKYDSDYKIKVKTKYRKETDIHGHTFTIPKYNKITIYEKHYKVLYYKTKKDTVNVWAWVNDYESGLPVEGVHFGASSFGWVDGEIYSGEIYVKPYSDVSGGSSSSGSSSSSSSSGSQPAIQYSF